MLKNVLTYQNVLAYEESLIVIASADNKVKVSLTAVNCDTQDKCIQHSDTQHKH